MQGTRHRPTSTGLWAVGTGHQAPESTDGMSGHNWSETRNSDSRADTHREKVLATLPDGNMCEYFKFCKECVLLPCDTASTDFLIKCEYPPYEQMKYLPC